MRKHLIALTLAFYSLLNVIAQEDFREGFIIKSNNDTIFGFIHYEGLFQNAKLCHFRKDETSKIQVFFPKDLLAYRFTDSRYFLTTPINTGTETENLFLECLLKGKVDIYRCYLDGMTHFYARKEDGPLRELQEKELMIEKDGTSFVKDSKEYIGILKTMFAECPEVAERVNTINLTQKSLVNIAHDYHYATCSDGNCIIYEKSLRPKNNRFEFGPLVGINTYQLKPMEKSKFSYWTWDNFEYTKVVYPSIGFFLRKNIPGLHDRLFIQYEAQWCWDKLLGKSHDYSVNIRDHYTCIRYDRQFIQNALLLRREYGLGKNSIALHFGTVFDYVCNSTYTHTTEVWNSAGDLVEDPVLLDTDNPFHKWDVGLLAGVDCSVPLNSTFDLIANLRYQYCVGLNGTYTDNTNKSFLSFNLGLAFGK